MKKKLLLFATLLGFCLAGYSQISLEKKVNKISGTLRSIQNSNSKITRYDSTTIHIYDENYNRIKVITGLPPFNNIVFPAANFFTTSGKIEFLLECGSYYDCYYYIYNEEKQLLYDFRKKMD